VQAVLLGVGDRRGGALADVDEVLSGRADPVTGGGLPGEQRPPGPAVQAPA